MSAAVIERYTIISGDLGCATEQEGVCFKYGKYLIVPHKEGEYSMINESASTDMINSGMYDVIVSECGKFFAQQLLDEHDIDAALDWADHMADF